MTFNSQEIIQDIRKDFENMLEYVTGEQAQTATADDTERGLFKMLQMRVLQNSTRPNPQSKRVHFFEPGSILNCDI
jgi:hypothetical protein